MEHHAVRALETLDEEEEEEELRSVLAGPTCGGGYQGPGRSPDRADAMVWAMTELLVKRRAEPRISAF